MHIGIAIKIIRKKRELSQTQLAKNVRISQAFLSFIEKGLREPGFKLIKRIANSLQVPEQIIFLLACDKKIRLGEHAKHMEKLALTLDDILRQLRPN